MKRRTRIASCLTTFGVAMVCSTMVLGDQSAILPTNASVTEANITRLTTSLLEHSQFAHHPLDLELAGRFLDSYLDALDGAHTLFLQSDLDEFAAYRATLALATRRAGNTSAARTILGRCLQRLEQRNAYVTNLLKTASFDFTGHDVYSFDREHAQWPQDLRAAQELWQQQLRAEYLQEKLGDVQSKKIVDALTRRYAQQLHTMQALRSDEVLEIYLNALAHVYDPHSDYLGHEQMENLSIAMNLSLFGIGASLEAVDGYCKVRELLPGGPAAKGGLLKPGDRIVAVAQAGKDPIDIVNMPISRAVELIRGPKGSIVTLTVIPVGAAESSLPRKVSLVRDEIQLEDQQAKARIVDLPNANGTKLRLGVIDLPSFYASTDEHKEGGRRSVTADVARLLTKLKQENVQGLVIDLRRNGGGLLSEAISLTGLFIREGPVVQTRGPSGDVEVDADTDPAVLYDGPLVVLTSRFSASASEILVGALQDYGRAVVVGDSSTFGKGTVQSILPLARLMDEGGLAHSYDPGALKITIRKFYRPSGASTQLRGVASDIVLPSTSDFSDVSESAMKDPLPWDAVRSLPYEHLNRVKPYVDTLREKSVQRITTKKDFVSLADEVARLKKSLAAKAISLNEGERRRELAQSKARQIEREKVDKRLRATRPTTYEITLKNASSTGLPRPLAFTDHAGTGGATTSSSAKDALHGSSIERLSANDIILNECVQILADYVGLLSRPIIASGVGMR